MLKILNNDIIHENVTSHSHNNGRVHILCNPYSVGLYSNMYACQPSQLTYVHVFEGTRWHGPLSANHLKKYDVMSNITDYVTQAKQCIISVHVTSCAG